MSPVSTEQKRGLLRELPLFEGISPADLEDIVRVARSKRLPVKGELFHKGDPGNAVYAIVSGKLKALTTSDEGDDVVFSILGPGEIFGEIALLGGGLRTATVTAIDPVELLVIGKAEFLDFLTRKPDAAVSLLGALARRIERLSALVEDTQFLNLPVRFAKKLIELAGTYGEPTEEGLRIDLALSQEEWGDMIGATRESVNKLIRSWTRRGLIRVEQRRILIHELEELERLSGALGGC